MSSNINRVTLSGRLTKDAELRSTPSGMPILSFGVAVNDRRRNPQTGEWEDVPNFIDCVLFGNRGQSLSQYLTKGQKIALEGKLRWSQWEKDGNKRSKVEVVVDEVELMSGGQQGGVPRQAAPAPQYGVQQPQMYQNAMPQQMAPQMPPQQPQYGGYQPTVQPPAPVQQDVYSEDIPF